MKSTLAIAVLLALGLSRSVHAIEDFQLQVQGTNVVLSWPSTESETFIVRYRARIDAVHPWTILTNDLPAAQGTNRTALTHFGVVEFPSGGGGGGGGGNPPPLEGALDDSDGIGATNNEMTSWPPLPPMPWDPRFVWDSSAGIDAALTEGGGEEVPLGSTGFYQVVRVGIYLSAIYEGTVLTDEIPLLIELGNPYAEAVLAEVFLTEDGSDENLPGSKFPPLPVEPGATVTGSWDTTRVPNGDYVLQVGARLDNDVVYLGQAVTVTVSNVVFYPDPWEVGGEAIYVGAQTIYTSGSWALDVYDDQAAHVGHLEGDIASDGFCNYSGIPGPGFSLDNTDGAGNQNPSKFYTLAMTVQSAGGGAPSTSTRKVFIEPPWFICTRSVVCYKQPFQSWQPGWDDVLLLMQAIWSVEEPFHQNLLGTFLWPFQIQTPANWSTVTNQMARVDARDFFYFGHGSGSTMGDAVARLTLGQVQTLLGNNFNNPLTATNMHPYRFVFIDGCNTADGDWPQAFGIPKKTGMVATDFGGKRGIRPRAFMGWNRKKVFTAVLGGSQLHPPHQTYIITFWDKWAEQDQNGRPVRDITQAKDAAANAAPNAALGMVIYGAKDLVITN